MKRNNSSGALMITLYVRWLSNIEYLSVINCCSFNWFHKDTTETRRCTRSKCATVGRLGEAFHNCVHNAIEKEKKNHSTVLFNIRRILLSSGASGQVVNFFHVKFNLIKFLLATSPQQHSFRICYYSRVEEEEDDDDEIIFGYILHVCIVVVICVFSYKTRPQTRSTFNHARSASFGDDDGGRGTLVAVHPEGHYRLVNC
ncbi:hypothetical protein T4B_14325 [Trichinella pseudospiralis]|uniref:Uncharacterized protein n=1 Tax=Trichinella pseudospiralis TaxID=6337 RepID=A0A0V1IHJ7_TRIPS|nr:hypothetical protein T4B_14325 [Trichinella pseudospiralis]KRZ39782.1 hypothetical protein T4C_587 [Trichinella pseudospiralis]